jgi:hypothetical protein
MIGRIAEFSPGCGLPHGRTALFRASVRESCSSSHRILQCLSWRAIMKGGWICSLVPVDGQLGGRLTPPAAENEPQPHERPPPAEPFNCGVGNAGGGGRRVEIRDPKTEIRSPKGGRDQRIEVGGAMRRRQFLGLLAGSGLAFGGLNCTRRTSSQPTVP